MSARHLLSQTVELSNPSYGGNAAGAAGLPAEAVSVMVLCRPVSVGLGQGRLQVRLSRHVCLRAGVHNETPAKQGGQ